MPAKLAASLFIVLHLAGSCTDPSEIGLVLDPSTNQIGVFYAEIPLSASMVLYDSFNTTSQGRLVIGGDVDDFFGKTEAIGYSRLSYNPNAAKPNAEAIFDSAVFTINVQSVFGVDFDQPKTFSVHRLEEPILDTSYYNFNSLRFSDETIAGGSFSLRPDTVNTLRMPLNPDLAGELFDKLTNSDPAFSNIFNFREYFPGIAIKGNPEENTSVSVAVGNGTGMMLYYHYDEDTVSRSFPISTLQSRHFVGVTSDRNGTPTEVITERGVAYDVPGNLVGGKSTLGLFVKLNTQALETFLDTLESTTFNQILLEVGPIEEYPEFKWPTRNMVMFFSGENNRLYRRFDGAVIAVQSEGASQTSRDQAGNIVPSAGSQNSLNLNEETRVFRNQVTSYVNALYRDGLIRTDLMLYPNFPSTQNNPVTSDESKRSLRQYKVNKDRIVLKVYYTKVR
ncbi:MAG: DUF4270 family protein [Lunatimonas sp.]|uniref:DUF4270 family protein n=1 Tax=Lunatimonas sp. TaxID=2060141 RepID=UPI00263B66FE|nr:DUF4270 family protein [Lunatimonas sp.]MCC5937369.1 DUF4270 family protein [Lunatimonas sp.]